MAAWPSVMAGKNVLMIERGDWVPRGPQNRGADGFFALTPAYSSDAPYRVLAGGDSDTLGTIACVGGASVFFGGVSLRLRERDFEADPDIVGDSGAEWPYRYRDLEPFYSKAEQLLGVAGAAGQDPDGTVAVGGLPAGGACRVRRWLTGSLARPDRSGCILFRSRSRSTTRPPRPGRPASRATPATASPAPFTRRTTLSAIHPGSAGARPPARDQHDGGAPDDRGPPYRGSGVRRSPHAAAAPVCRSDRRRRRRRARDAPSAPGVGTRQDEPGRGRRRPLPDAPLQRDSDGMVRQEAGAARRVPQAHRHPRLLFRASLGRVAAAASSGCLQQFGTPQTDYVLGLAGGWIERHTAGWRQAAARTVARTVLPAIVRRISGLIAIAEDRPNPENRVALAEGPPNRFGMPSATITHRYDARDLAARDALVGAARRILREAGAMPVMFPYNIQTFSHAVGTVRLGVDPSRSPLDERGGVPRPRQPVRHRRQRAAAIGRREPVADDRRQRAADGDAHRRGAMTAIRVSRNRASPPTCTPRRCARLRRTSGGSTRAATATAPLRPRRGTRAPGTSPATRRHSTAARSTSCSLRCLPRRISSGRSAPSRLASTSSSRSRRFCSASDFDQVAAAASAAKRQVLVAENYFYKPLAALLRSIVQGGDIGERAVHPPERVEGAGDRQLARRSVAGRRWRAVRGWHPLGQPAGEHRPDAGADSCGASRRPGDPNDRSAAVTLEYAEGAVATLHYSWDLRRCHQRRALFADLRHRWLRLFRDQRHPRRRHRPPQAALDARTDRSGRISRYDDGLPSEHPRRTGRPPTISRWPGATCA